MKRLGLILSVIVLASISLIGQSDTVLITQLKPVSGIFTLDGEAYSGEAYFIKSDGTPMVMRSYRDGVKEGLWRTWHANGNLYKEGSTLQDKEHGEYKEYYENGILKYQYHYDLGVKTGTWFGWYEDGTLYTERNFKEGKLHGRLVHYDENGEPRLTEEYRDGNVFSTDRFKPKGEGVKIEQKK